MLTRSNRYLRRPLLAQPERQGREEINGDHFHTTSTRPPTHDTTNTTTTRTSSTVRLLYRRALLTVFLDATSNTPYTIDPGLTGYPESRAGAQRHERRKQKDTPTEREEAKELKARIYTHESRERRELHHKREALEFLLAKTFRLFGGILALMLSF
jgi:hypothetical protein